MGWEGPEGYLSRRITHRQFSGVSPGGADCRIGSLARTLVDDFFLDDFLGFVIRRFTGIEVCVAGL